MYIGFFGKLDQQKKDSYTNALADHQLEFIDTDLSAETLPSETGFEVLSVFVTCKVDQKVIDHFPNLKLIVARSTGFDNIDTKYAKQKNIAVANVPAYGSNTVAEFTFGLILSLTRKIPQAVNRVKQELKFNYQGLKGFDLNGKTIGIVGTGKIGLNVIKIAKGFDMNVLAYDLFPNHEAADKLQFQYTDLDTLYSSSDIITLHCPATKESYHLINQQSILKIKKGAILINTSRGSVVETKALVQALDQQILSAAGLDVLEEEEEFKRMDQSTLQLQELTRMGNVILTPHMAFYTEEAEEKIVQTTTENIKTFIAGNPSNIVTNG